MFSLITLRAALPAVVGKSHESTSAVNDDEAHPTKDNLRVHELFATGLKDGEVGLDTGSGSESPSAAQAADANERESLSRLRRRR